MVVKNPMSRCHPDKTTAGGKKAGDHHALFQGPRLLAVPTTTVYQQPVST